MAAARMESLEGAASPPATAAAALSANAPLPLWKALLSAVRLAGRRSPAGEATVACTLVSAPGACMASNPVAIAARRMQIDWDGVGGNAMRRSDGVVTTATQRRGD